LRDFQWLIKELPGSSKWLGDKVMASEVFDVQTGFEVMVVS